MIINHLLQTLLLAKTPSSDQSHWKENYVVSKALTVSNELGRTLRCNTLTFDYSNKQSISS